MIGPMRLLFLLRQLNVGGAQRQVVELARALDPKVFDITVVTFYGGGKFAPLVEEIPHVRLISVEKRGRWEVLGFFRRLIRAVRLARPDVIHSYLTLPDTLAVLLKLFIPRVRVVWGVRASNIDLGRYDWLERAADRLRRALARFPDLIIVNSDAGRRHHVASGFPESKTIVIQNGIDVRRFRPGADGSGLRRAWSVSEREVLFGVVGRIDPTKDQLTFIRAAARVRRQLPHARFVLIGPRDGRYPDVVRSEVERLALQEAVVFAGAMDVDASTYAALDVFVSCSASEGFPNAVAEAMACGRRCVVTDAGDSAAIVGRHGLVLPPGDPEAMAAAMVRAVELPIESAEAARSIAERFGTELLARRTAEALLGLRS